MTGPKGERQTGEANLPEAEVMTLRKHFIHLAKLQAGLGTDGDWRRGGGIISCLCLACSVLKTIAKQLLELEGCTPNPCNFCSVMLPGELLPGSARSLVTRRIKSAVVTDVRSLQLPQASCLDVNNWG